MRFSDIVRNCMRSLIKRKIRTLLTVSGVLIGTSAVIVMFSLGIGMNVEITKMLEEWADLTVIQIDNYRWNSDAADEPPPTLDDDMLDVIRGFNHVKAVLPFNTNYYGGYEIAIYSEDGYIIQGPIIGTVIEEMENFGYKIKEGRFKEGNDAKNTVIFGPFAGAYVYNYLYDEWLYANWDWETDEMTDLPVDNWFGQQLHFIPLSRDSTTWQTDYSVIGSKTALNMEYDTELNLVGMIEAPANDWNAREGIFIDTALLMEMVNAYNEVNPDTQLWIEDSNGYNNVKVRVDDMANVPDVEAEIKALGLNTWSFNEYREQMMGQITTIQMLLAAVAAVSLFVAALNITNTMIMAIIERTKEIGIMKVLGCDVGKIRLLFLGEAAAIGFLGGSAGIGLSYLLSFLINNFFGGALMGMFGGGAEEGATVTISIIPPYLALLALGGATLIGMAAGFYPAHRSTRISALSAIAHE